MVKKDLASKFILDGVNCTVVESILNKEETKKWGERISQEMYKKFEERRRYALKYLSEHPEILNVVYD